jgi:hypothetical protein
MSVAPDPGRGRTSPPQESRGRRHPLADVLAAVMLLLATLTYLGRLVWGLSQPGYEIQPRDFGSLLAAIIAIPAGVLLVTGMKPAVARLTGGLGAGAMLLFNVVNLTGGSVDDVIGKYGTWAAIPIVVTTAIAIVALYRGSWSPEEFLAAPAEEQDEDVPQQRADEYAEHMPYEEHYAPQSRPADEFGLHGSASAAEPAAGVISAPEPADQGVIAPSAAQRSPFNLPPMAQAEPLIPEPSLPERAQAAVPEPEIPQPEMPDRAQAEPPMAQAPLELPVRPTPDRSSLELPELSLPESATRTRPVERSAPDRPAPLRQPEPEFGVAGPAGSPAQRPGMQPVPANAAPPAPESYVPERLAPRPAGPDTAAEPQPEASSPAHTPPTEPFAQQDPTFHAATDGIPAVAPVDPPTAVLPRPDFTANPQQSGPPPVEPPQSGRVAAPPAEPDPRDMPFTPPPFQPAGHDRVHPGRPVEPPAPTPETAPLRAAGHGVPNGTAVPPQPEPPRPQNISAPRPPGFPDGVAPQQGNPPRAHGPVHQPFGPPPVDIQHTSLRLPGTEPIPTQPGPRRPVLRQPGGFLAPPPVDPEPGQVWPQSVPGQPYSDAGRPQLHDVSAAERLGPPDSQPPRAEDEASPIPLDHRQAPPKRLAPSPWAQEQ